MGALRYRGVVHHGYSHFTVELHVFEGAIPNRTVLRSGRGRRWVTPAQLRKLPLPQATEKVLERLGLGSLSRGE